MKYYQGDRVRLHTTEGNYVGSVQSIDLQSERITISNVTFEEGDENEVLPGLQNFYKSEIKQIDRLEVYSKKEGPITVDKNKPSDFKPNSKHMPAHLDRLKTLTIKDACGPSKEDMLVDVNYIPCFTRKNIFDDTIESMINLKIFDLTSSETECVRIIEMYACPASYTIIDRVDEEFYKAVNHFSSEKIIGVAAEGVNIGRDGELLWLQMASNSQVTLFDMYALKVAGMRYGLTEILENEHILKVFHDCRGLSDMMYHQYGIKLVNIFDTQVAGSLHRSYERGQFCQFVDSLSVSLQAYLKFPNKMLNLKKERVQSRKEDQLLWKERPLPEKMLDLAVHDVRYLRQLRVVIYEELTKDLTRGFDIYLSEWRDASKEDLVRKQKTPHYLPEEFKLLQMHTHRSSNFTHFTPNGLIDANVVFSRDGLSHRRGVDYLENRPKSRRQPRTDVSVYQSFDKDKPLTYSKLKGSNNDSGLEENDLNFDQPFRKPTPSVAIPFRKPTPSVSIHNSITSIHQNKLKQSKSFNDSLPQTSKSASKINSNFDDDDYVAKHFNDNNDNTCDVRSIEHYTCKPAGMEQSQGKSNLNDIGRNVHESSSSEQNCIEFDSIPSCSEVKNNEESIFEKIKREKMKHGIK